MEYESLSFTCLAHHVQRQAKHSKCFFECISNVHFDVDVVKLIHHHLVDDDDGIHQSLKHRKCQNLRIHKCRTSISLD